LGWPNAIRVEKSVFPCSDAYLQRCYRMVTV
jgi:hypothetical protein